MASQAVHAVVRCYGLQQHMLLPQAWNAGSGLVRSAIGDLSPCLFSVQRIWKELADAWKSTR